PIIERVIAAEALRRAFLALDPPLAEQAISASTHGDFGETGLWKTTFRKPIAQWLANAADAVAPTREITHHTELENDDLDRLDAFVRTGLIERIDRAVDSGHFDIPELSELLANAGVLPMFGFPTRARPLYMEAPQSRRSHDKSVVSTRPLDMAVASFAPGAEVTKNKATHVCVGFAAYRPFRGKLTAVDPLQQRLEIQQCTACNGVLPTADAPSRDAPCSICGGDTRNIDLFQPSGFRTDFQPRDYDDTAEIGSPVDRPVLAWQQEPDGTRIRAVSARSLQARELYTINDRDGDLYAMHRHEGGYVVTTPDVYDDWPAIPRLADVRDPDLTGAIGAVRPTDVLLIEPGWLALPASKGALTVSRARPFSEAALWSYAEILRIAAADLLSVDPRELDVGLQPYAAPHGPSRRIFIADRLENGAGYARHLGRPAMLERLLDHAVDVLGPGFMRTEHRERCEASCPDCLASYDNRFLHSRLDWRLGLDLAELAAGRDLDERRWLDDAPGIAASVAAGFELEHVVLDELQALRDSDGTITILGHPIWLADGQPRDPRQLAAERASRAPVIRHADLHSALRFPQRIVVPD
ncbi:DUF1998 domain-containing protein, partial [Patulibacter sp. NPDC049589]|uniref:DUF1998 domain-containing protein n=1 Tax=Patulibacter sp. NPDC049589 TaxID=3154731 RepID=UPI0034438C6F